MRTDQEFWDDVVIAAVRAGGTGMTARSVADVAVTSRQARIQRQQEETQRQADEAHAAATRPTDEEIELFKQDGLDRPPGADSGKIIAVKSYRNRTGAYLRDAVAILELASGVKMRSSDPA